MRTIKSPVRFGSDDDCSDIDNGVILRDRPNESYQIKMKDWQYIALAFFVLLIVLGLFALIQLIYCAYTSLKCSAFILCEYLLDIMR